jgi:hypothetical protein
MLAANGINGRQRRFPGIIGNRRLGHVLLGQHFETAPQ